MAGCRARVRSSAVDGSGEVKRNMTVSTDVPITLGSLLTSDPVARRQGETKGFKPVMLQVSGTAGVWYPDLSDDAAVARSQGLQRTFAPPMATAAVAREINADSAPLQVWEGTVLEVDHAASVMHVLLDAKIGQMPRHTGEIDLEWVSEQDQDLVRPGAVFYLTLFKRTQHGSIENAQELRFRRRPSWTVAQLKQIEEDAATLLSKMKPLPTSA